MISSEQYSAFNNLIDRAFSQMQHHIVLGNNNKSVLIDPNDNARVIGHYGETHLCAAMMYYAERSRNNDYLQLSLNLLDGILSHWDDDKKSKEFHADFNNFALALIYERLSSTHQEETATIVAKRLFETFDSKNHTINWLPMRAYVNLLKYKLSSNKYYLQKAIDSLNSVKDAQYSDGLFEDLLPKGKSFNLQYCISTAATIQLIYDHFAEFITFIPKIDLNNTISTLYSLVLPDGDINYMGRGCNQIFAWGPWKYIMSSHVNEAISEQSLIYLFERLEESFLNHNLMLNDYCGAERVLWWDYHHYSVYMSHFLLWNELSFTHKSHHAVNKLTSPTDSGLRIYKNDKICAVTFNGREHYLVEQGGALVALWCKDKGTLFKCGHSASNGKFSTKYFNPLTAYFNHFGVIKIVQKPRRITNKYVRKVYQFLFDSGYSLQVIPLFSNYRVKIDNNRLIIETDLPSNKADYYFIFPCYLNIEHTNIKLFVDNKEHYFKNMGVLQTQYGNIMLYLSKIENGQTCDFILET